MTKSSGYMNPIKGKFPVSNFPVSKDKKIKQKTAFQSSGLPDLLNSTKSHSVEVNSSQLSRLFRDRLPEVHIFPVQVYLFQVKFYFRLKCFNLD